MGCGHSKLEVEDKAPPAKASSPPPSAAAVKSNGSQKATATAAATTKAHSNGAKEKKSSSVIKTSPARRNSGKETKRSSSPKQAGANTYSPSGSLIRARNSKTAPPAKQAGASGSLIRKNKTKKKHSKHGGGAVDPPSTRQRADTWEVPSQAVHEEEVARLQAQHQERIVKQWKTLWDTQSHALVDPADVPAVLEGLLSKTVNRLSPVQLLFLQRKIRYAVALSSSSTTAGSKMMAKVFAPSSHQQYSDPHARTAAEKHHVVSASVLQRVLPPSIASDSIITLMTGFSESLWERVRLAAADAAVAAGLEMDVNKQNKGAASWEMPPKPSQIPVLSEPINMNESWPVGASLQAVAAVLSLAVTGSRRQKLQLLFYALMDAEILQDFLATHPAGGVPVWLLEVGNNTVTSLPALTHYHYYGNAFLPCSTSSTSSSSSNKTPEFYASKSRLPVTIEPQRCLQIIAEALLHAAGVTDEEEEDEEEGGARVMSMIQQPVSESVSMLMKDSATIIGGGATLQKHRETFTPLFRKGSSANGDAGNNGGGGGGSDNGGAPLDVDNGVYPQTPVTRKLEQVADNEEQDVYCTKQTELSQSVHWFEAAVAKFFAQNVSEPVVAWTLEEFHLWTASALDDLALDIVLHRLLGEGVFTSPAIERDLVLAEWSSWQTAMENRRNNLDGKSVTEMISSSVTALLGSWHSSNGSSQYDGTRLGTVWGGIGNIDGGGGTGHGVLYCVPAQWWSAWTVYTGWSFVGDLPKPPRKRKGRPPSLLTEPLLEHDPEIVPVRGALGSYEVMRQGVRRGKDYVLVPPGVWDILFELYGGGPPLPRMVQSSERKTSLIAGFDPPTTQDEIMPPQSRRSQNNNNTKLDQVMGDLQSGTNNQRVERIPDRWTVETHPWVLHVQLCDPLQPYRRGDTGPLSIRVMVSAGQPLWRLLGEILIRFTTLQTYRAFDPDGGGGMVRLWKRVDVSKEAMPRYGPWNLLCHSRNAKLPLITDGLEMEDSYDDLVKNWKAYADDATVESIGLGDKDSLLLEFAVLNKNGVLTWPREAAAKAGKARRLAEEDRKFRQLLEGIDDDGNMLPNPPELVGMEVDAMDPSGRWYMVKILAVDIVDGDTDDEEEEEEEADDDSGEQKKETIARKKVKVHFNEHGHYEWIDVESDRLQTAGRFASESESQLAVSPQSNGSGNGDGRVKSSASAKRANSNAENVVAENTKSCPLPGFGSCGLANLGNTCYMNSAVQCLAYVPLLRAYLLSAQYKATGDLNKDNPLGTGGKLLEEFAELMRTMWSSRFAEKSPNRFRTILGKTNGQFSGADQQDAQEFLNYIIDVLHEDCNKVRKKPYVEALEDSWVEKTPLPRVGDEAWRRFLRRNRSIMADVAMGQALNTVTCPVCNHMSRNFDPFNLLSIPIPTIADVVFQCTVFRRATATNCPWILNKPRKGDKVSSRFSNKKQPDPRTGPPSETFVAEQYVIALSRLADGGDIRLQLQNLTGIRANRLRLCRVEEVVNENAAEASVTNKHIKVFPLSDKEGPASQHAKKRGPNDSGPRAPTQLIAFEFTLNTRRIEDMNGKGGASDDTADEDEEEDAESLKAYPTPAEKTQIEKYLSIYGDEKECRLMDTDPLVIAKAVSRSLWPRSDSDLKLGLRVDAKDHRGNWFPGSIVDIFEDEIKASDADTGQEVSLRQKKVRIHFDNFLSKWDEVYSIDQFKKGKVHKLYSHAEPKVKPTEFLVHHRHSSRGVGHSVLFGHSFYIQCQNEWSNARAGAHILAQVSRFLQQRHGEQDPHRISDKAQAAISELIDLLVDCDREFIRLALGVSRHNNEKERESPFRNPSFDPSAFISATNTKVSALLHRLPFEVRLCTVEAANSGKPRINNEEIGFPFSLTKTIGNSVSIRNAVILHWREPPTDKKNGTQRNSASAVMYTEPLIHVHESSAEILDSESDKKADGKSHPGSAGIDLGFCLTEFCKVQKLPLSDNWICPVCKVVREGGQNMNLWRLPDLLTFHIKRFNMSARWHEKISTKVDFPMTGLDMSKWCHKESPVLSNEPEDSYVYDLIGVMNHYGSLTGGHYVATCKASRCGGDGREEVAYNFNGVGASAVESGGPDEPSGWGLGRAKPKVNQSKVEAAVSSKAVADSAEPMWLQFDDEVVEPIPPRQVVSEMAYVLFYRRRRLTPSNIAKYSTLE